MAAADDALDSSSPDFTASLEGQGGFEHARFKDKTEQGGAVRGLLDVEIDLPLKPWANLIWTGSIKGEYAPSMEAGEISTDLKVDIDIASCARIMPRLLWHGGEGVGRAFDLLRFRAELATEIELAPTTFFIDAGYCFDYDDIPSLPRHDRRNSAFLGLSLSVLGEFQFLARIELRAEVLDSSDSGTASESSLCSGLLVLSKLEGFSALVFAQYGYESFRAGGHAHSVQLIARLETKLLEHLWFILEYEGMMEENKDKDANFLTHRLSGGLKIEL
jgi:hypothetical protein